MSGALATQTPPWPTAMPEGILSPSAKTVNLSALPSPSVSSSTLTRSRPGPGLLARIFQALGDPDPAPLVERHRHRIDDVGLGGDQLDSKAGGKSSSGPPRTPAAAGSAAGPGRAGSGPSVGAGFGPWHSIASRHLVQVLAPKRGSRSQSPDIVAAVSCSLLRFEHLIELFE